MHWLAVNIKARKGRNFIVKVLWRFEITAWAENNKTHLCFLFSFVFTIVFIGISQRKITLYTNHSFAAFYLNCDISRKCLLRVLQTAFSAFISWHFMWQTYHVSFGGKRVKLHLRLTIRLIYLYKDAQLVASAWKCKSRHLDSSPFDSIHHQVWKAVSIWTFLKWWSLNCVASLQKISKVYFWKPKAIVHYSFN